MIMPANGASSDELDSIKSDPLLSAFLSPTFSPTNYLNTTLPSLSTTTSSAATSTSANGSPAAVSLSAIHSTATDLLSTLDVHLNRLQTTLSSLTDDILRSTPRLGYE